MSATATRTYTAEEQATNRAKWVEALRSGKFRQGANWLLGRDSESYCCLGVACVLAEKEGVVRVQDFEFGMVPPREVQDWLGLTHEQGVTGVLDNKGEQRKLTTLNDNDGFTFADIADVIEGGSLEVQA